MAPRRFTRDEGSVFYEDTEGDVEVDVPDELYRRWRGARAAVGQAEQEIDAIYAAQHPWDPPEPEPRPEWVLAEPTAPVPTPRTVDEYREANP